MTKTELFTIAIISESNVEYLNINGTSLERVENPLKVSKCFSHDDAHAVKNVLRQSKDFLKEGEKMRVKALTQCLRDYCGRLLQTGFANTTVAGTETVNGVKKEYVVEKTEEKAEEVPAETPVEEKPKKKAKKENETTEK